jgi:hypothetical protein
MSVKLALLGVVLPAAVILTVTLVAAIVPRLQGLLLTAEGLCFFIVAMMLFPKLHFNFGTEPAPTNGTAALADGGTAI